MYIVNNLELFVINCNWNTSATKNSMNLYLPIANLRVFQKGPEFFAIKVYNNLPGSIKQLSNNKKKFREALLLFLYAHSFYNTDEFVTKVCINHDLTHIYIYIYIYKADLSYHITVQCNEF
jgi:hypothetical protein